MNLRTRISLTYIGIVLFGVALVGVLASWALQSYFDNRAVETSHEKLQALTSLFADGRLRVDSTGTNDDELGRLAQTLGLRLTVVAHTGRVLFDSQVPRDSLSRLENHAHRPEIVRAAGGSLGSDRRMSASVNIPFLYAALMITGPNAGNLDSCYVRTALPLLEISAIDHRIQAIVWGVGTLTVLLTVVVSFQVSKRITRPVLSMARTAQQIKDGDLEQRIEIRSSDEFGSLARTINEMAAKLSADIGQLRKLERIRSEFLGNVSHELRTPIFSIQGFLETLLDGAIDDPAVNREFLEKAHRQAARLNTLLNDLIEISRIESGDMKMSFRYIDAAELLEGVVGEVEEQAEKKNITLEVVSGLAPGERVYGDRERLKQALLNLVDNALKYTEPGGRIVCRAVADDGHVVFSVEDTGCGIPAEHLPRIFERFYRVDRDRSRAVGGTGLGLAIVKHIIEAHGSTVSVASVVGKGTTFSFSLKR